MTLIEHDIRKTSIKNDKNGVGGICVFLPFHLFEKGKKGKPPKYDESLINKKNEICLFDVKDNTQTYYQIERIKKIQKGYGYNLFLREKTEGESTQYEEITEETDNCLYDI